MTQSKWKVGDKVVFVAKSVACTGYMGTICEVDNISGRAAMKTLGGEKTGLWSDDSFNAASDEDWKLADLIRTEAIRQLAVKDYGQAS